MVKLTKEKNKKFLFYKRSLRKHQTDYEKKFATILEKRKIRFFPQKGFFIDEEHFFIVDFYIPKPYKIVFEIDGKSHNEKKQINWDNQKDMFLRRRGIISYHIKHEYLDDYLKLNNFLDFILNK